MTAVLTFFGILRHRGDALDALEMLVIGIILTVLAVMGGLLARLFRQRSRDPAARCRWRS